MTNKKPLPSARSRPHPLSRSAPPTAWETRMRHLQQRECSAQARQRWRRWRGKQRDMLEEFSGTPTRVTALHTPAVRHHGRHVRLGDWAWKHLTFTESALSATGRPSFCWRRRRGKENPSHREHGYTRQPGMNSQVSGGENVLCQKLTCWDDAVGCVLHNPDCVRRVNGIFQR